MIFNYNDNMTYAIPDYLIILLTIMAVFIIVLCIVGLLVIRRITIISKKVDFLIEDITYKSESLSPLIDSMLKISSYVDVMEIILKKNSNAIKHVAKNNKNNIDKFKKQLERVINEK